ncbi:MAG: GAF domain-containing protein [Gemmatimonadaceae bacterium]
MKAKSTFGSSEFSAPRIAPLNAVLRTSTAARRPLRRTDIATADGIYQSLAATLFARAAAIPQAVVRAAVTLCGAGSAGISILEQPADGPARFRWTVVAGRLSKSVDFSTPADFSTGGVCAEREEPVRFAFPERRFTYLQGLGVAFVEMLEVPLHVDGRSLGTLWTAAHTVGRRFGEDETETLTRLSAIAGTSYTRAR